MLKRPMLMMGFVIRDVIIAGYRKVGYLKTSGASLVKHRACFEFEFSFLYREKINLFPSPREMSRV